MLVTKVLVLFVSHYFLHVTSARDIYDGEDMEFADERLDALDLRNELDTIPEWSLPNQEKQEDYFSELLSLIKKEKETDDNSVYQPLAEVVDNSLNDETDSEESDRTSEDNFFLEEEENDEFFDPGDDFKDERYEDINDDDLSSTLRNFRDWNRKRRMEESTRKKARRCSSFSLVSSVSTKSCGETITLLGTIEWCRIDCITGYRIKKSHPQYEICGKATEYKWSYQLKGHVQPPERCELGSSSSSFQPCTTPECFATAAYYMNKIDFTVNPCDNFFDFACGKWNREKKIPKTKSYYTTYSVVRDRVNKEVAELLKKPVSRKDLMPLKKAKLFFKSCMDIKKITQLGSRPILNFLKGDLAWPIIKRKWDKRKFNFESTAATLRGSYNSKNMMCIKVGTWKGKYTLEFWKGSMPLPFAYYFKKHLKFVLDKYYLLMYKVAVLLGARPKQALWDVGEMKKFEMKLAERKIKCKDEMDKMTVRKLQTNVPGINWLKMLKKMVGAKSKHITADTVIVVWNQSYLKSLVKLLQTTDKRVVQNYMVWTIVKNRIKNLDHRFENLILQLKSAMFGAKALQPRVQKCSNEAMLGMKAATGKLFIDHFFSKKSKKAAEELFEFIRKGFLHLLETEVHWMDKKTKSYAKRKALALSHRIGYNPHLYENTTYLNELVQNLVIRPTDYFGNYLRLLKRSAGEEFSKLGQPHNVSVYSFTARPTMVNAFYTPRYNTMVVPAGELQYPFYWGSDYERVIQFGAIGTILGHELTHGFDNSGRKFDIHGNVKNWWSPKSLKEFNKRTSCMKKQYSNYFWKPARNFLNGKKELGENIADNGGIRESHAGYKLWLQARNISQEEIHPAMGFTNDQLFFIAFANDRCGHYSRYGAIHSLAVNPHSPERFRVIGSLQNFGKFSHAYTCPLGSFMNPKHKCIIW